MLGRAGPRQSHGPPPPPPPHPTLPQFVNFKLYHSLGLRYPPVLDPKLEAAAAGLDALMKELAASGGGAVAALPTGAADAPGLGDEERGVNPEAQQRLGSLADKVGRCSAQSAVRSAALSAVRMLARVGMGPHFF